MDRFASAASWTSLSTTRSTATTGARRILSARQEISTQPSSCSRSSGVWLPSICGNWRIKSGRAAHCSSRWEPEDARWPTRSARSNGLPLMLDTEKFPSFAGIVFSNEFFDALPVDLVVSSDSGVRERRVAMKDDAFVWDDSTPSEVSVPDGVTVRELQHHRLLWLQRIAQRLQRGWIVTVDYGYRKGTPAFP